MISSRQIESSIKRGIAYICHHQNPDGYWYEFQTNSSGPSSDWITSIVLFSLSPYEEELFNDCMEKGFNNISFSGKKRGGWGWSLKVPSDCDSTSTAILAFSSYRRQIQDLKKHFVYLLEHQDKETGGFSTFSRDDALKKYRKKMDDSYVGWMSPHTCVTAMALRALKFYQGDDKSDRLNKAVGFLLKKQNKEGFWDSYWWRTKYYATYHIIAGLMENEITLCMNNLEIAFDWIYETQHNEGFWDNGFDKGPCMISTCHALSSLILLNRVINRNISSTIEKGLDWVLCNQRANGSWCNKPFFQIPPSNVRYPNLNDDWKTKQLGSGSISSDQNRIYTTTVVLFSLNGLRY